MIRILVLLSIALIVGAGIYHLTQMENAYMVMVLNKTSIKIPFATMLLFCFLGLLCIYIVWKVINVVRKASRYRNQRAQDKTYLGLIAFIEGNWLQAKRFLVSGSAKSSVPAVNYLAAARCAHELGEEQTTMDFLKKAQDLSSHGQLAVLLTQAKLQFERRQFESVLQTLTRAKGLAPEHPMVLYYLAKTYQALSDWKSLAALVPALNRNQVGSASYRNDLELSLHRHWLSALITQSKALTNESMIANLLKHWREIPKQFQWDEVIVSRLVSQLMHHGDHAQAESMLIKGLKKHWYDSWVSCFGLLQGDGAQKRLSLAESWLKTHQNNAALLQALGRLCLQNQQWGRAADYFKQSIEVEPMAETFRELARLEKGLGNMEQSHFYTEQGLAVLSRQLPDLPMPS